MQQHDPVSCSCLETLAVDANDFWAPQKIARITQSISALEFLREYVQASVPVIFAAGSGLMDHWSARYSWQNWRCLEERVGSGTVVTVNVTPDGRGDAVVELPSSGEQVFVKPEERRMAFADFLSALSGPDFAGVAYLSHQNDSLHTEFPSLADDIDDAGFPIANQAFGAPPDAVNLWIGDERAVSSLHKDHYENMYCVLVGEKHFTLFPPCDAAAMPEGTFKPARYRFDDATQTFSIDVEHDGDPVTWLTLEYGPDVTAEKKNGGKQSGQPLRYLHPVECLVGAGEVLYLPAMWYHRVTQTCATVAVNFWFVREVGRTHHPHLCQHHHDEGDDSDDGGGGDGGGGEDGGGVIVDLADEEKGDAVGGEGPDHHHDHRPPSHRACTYESCL